MLPLEIKQGVYISLTHIFWICLPSYSGTGCKELCHHFPSWTNLPLCQQIPPRRLLLVGGINQHVAGGLGLCQPAQELLQVQVELLQKLQGRVQSRLPV